MSHPPRGVLSHAENGLEVRVIFNLGRKSFHRVSAQGKLPQLGVHLRKTGVFHGRDYGPNVRFHRAVSTPRSENYY